MTAVTAAASCDMISNLRSLIILLIMPLIVELCLAPPIWKREITHVTAR